MNNSLPTVFGIIVVTWAALGRWTYLMSSSDSSDMWWETERRCGEKRWKWWFGTDIITEIITREMKAVWKCRSHLSEDLHISMSLVEVTSLQARLCGSGLEESGTRTSAWGCGHAVRTSMFSSESKFNVNSVGGTWGSSTMCLGDLGSDFSCLTVGHSCLGGSSPPSMFTSASLSSEGCVEVLTWELPLGLRRGRTHLGLKASPSSSVSLLSGGSVPWAFFSTFLFFSFLTRFPLFRSDGEKGRFRIEGGSRECAAAQSPTLPASELLLLPGRSFKGGLKSGLRHFFVACMLFSVVSTRPDRLSLLSAGALKFSQLCSVFVWYSSGLFSGDGWKLSAGSAEIQMIQT